MKKIRLIYPATLLLIGLAIGTGCRKDRLDKLNISEQNAVEEMETAYSAARLYNDSLVSCAGTGSNCTDAYLNYCDSLFHHHEEEWNNHHGEYDHDNKHGDHHHDSNGMHHQSNQNNHDYNEGHHEHHHELMDGLLETHQPYHP